MMLLKGFNREFTVIRLNQFGKPKVAPLSALDLPIGSILHYIPNSTGSEIGPAQTFPAIELATKAVQVRHITSLTEDGIIGRPRRDEQGFDKSLLQYHRVNKKTRRMRKDAVIVKDNRTLLVENYAPLTTLYKYQPTLMGWYDRWYNIFLTAIKNVAYDADKYNRQNYIVLNVPHKLEAISKLRLAEKKRTAVLLKNLNDDKSLAFLELWTWLGKNREHSVFSNISPDNLNKINIVLSFNNKFINLNLGELNFWRKDVGHKGLESPDEMQKRLYKSAITLIETGMGDRPDIIQAENIKADEDISPEDQEIVEEQLDRSDAEEEIDPPLTEDDVDDFDTNDINENEVYEVLQVEDSEDEEDVKETEITVNNGIEKACAKYISSSTLTTKEYNKLIELSESYKSIKSPFDESKTLDEYMEVTDEDVNVEEEVLVDDYTLLDKSMTKTTTNSIRKKYITEILNKDITSSIVSIQKGGVAVSNYSAEPVIDAANRLMVHTIKVHPVKGDSSTIRLTTPLLDEGGYWVANDVKYTMRNQRIDKPIRKVKENTVALTTFYSTGKSFVRRSEKAASDYPKWLTDNISSIGLSLDNTTVRDLHFSNVFDPNVKVPRTYSMVAKHFSGFKSKGIVYNFDVKLIDEIFESKEIDELNKEGLTPIGKSINAIHAMDSQGMVYKKNDKGTVEIGTLPEVLEIDTEKAPKEYSEFTLMSKEVPLAFIFSYLYGFEKALKEFKVNYRVVEAGERVKKDSADMIIQLKDSKVIINFDTMEQSLIFNGLKPYLKVMKNFSLLDLNTNDVYLNLIQVHGLTNRALNELNLMENMFVDPINERILKKMKEPTDFKGLLKRSNEMLTYDSHPHEIDMNEMHILGTQRIAGAVYSSMVKGVRDFENKRSHRRKIDIPSNEVWQKISSDPSVMTASDANPIQSIKEADVVTFGGTGGRSARSMVKRTRAYGKNDLGVISGDTVDSGDVGITAYMAGNPTFETVDGLVKKVEDKEKLDPSNYLSAPAMLAPDMMYDDPKRINFIGIQHGSGTNGVAYDVPSYRTGFEKVVAHRTGPTQASIAEHDGKVTEITESGITVEYNTKPKTSKSYTLGRTFGRHEGAVFPHSLVTNFKVGQKFSKGAVLAFNEKFFAPDEVNPEQVNWKMGVYANTVFLESTDTWEDSSAISEDLSHKLATETTKIKNVFIKFDQAVHGLVKRGDKLKADTVLCVIEDALTANTSELNEMTVDTLRRLSAHAPTAELNGFVDKIEIFYNGDMEDMSESVLSIVKSGDRQRKSEAKSSAIKIASTGRVDSTLRIDNTPVELDTLVIRFYMTEIVPAIGGDKAVVANQMKSTFRRRMVGVNKTDDDRPLDIIFGKKAVDDRQVLSLYRIGVSVLFSTLISEQVREMIANE